MKNHKNKSHGNLNQKSKRNNIEIAKIIMQVCTLFIKIIIRNMLNENGYQSINSFDNYEFYIKITK